MLQCVFPQYLQNKWMNFDQNFVYALINTRSMFFLMHIIFGQFLTGLWPLINIRILFMLNILGINLWLSIRFCICVDIDKI